MLDGDLLQRQIGIMQNDVRTCGTSVTSLLRVAWCASKMTDWCDKTNLRRGDWIFHRNTRGRIGEFWERVHPERPELSIAGASFGNCESGAHAVEFQP